LVPLMGLIYLGGALAVILPSLDRVPGVLLLIVRDALEPRAAAGGLLGTLTGKAVRIGVSRGVFTNEAGMGSAAIIHGAADASSPAGEGLWGITEVFLDTIVMCTLTALVVLLSGLPADTDGAALTVAAFSRFLGKGAASFVALSTFFFAFASMLCWSCCGEAGLQYLSVGKRGILCYRILFSLSAALGAVFRLETVFRLSDLLNFLMALPNLAAVVLLSGTIERETRRASDKVHKNSSHMPDKRK
ncbi:MAG: alanine:cation symporter family protein, partial [Oscillospiraceae bacterium]|nr:alanine:cation symporter family protein [Oscillospiraceae bacterium]